MAEVLRDFGLVTESGGQTYRVRACGSELDESRPVEPPVMSTESVLNPFSVYRKGEAVLRDQLHALSGWHLVNIIRDYQLSEVPIEDLNTMREDELAELIVANVRVAVGSDALAPRAESP
jgi:hypothetical protein